jgi:hypothetical protein
MSYLYTRVKERFSFLPATCRMEKQGDSYRIGFCTQKEYCPYVRKFAEENIADVLSVGYKTRFFQDRLRIPLLDNREKNLLITALVAADYKDDKTHVSRKLRGLKSYCLDGVYNFGLHDLKKRWEGVAEYVPTDMNADALDEFIGYLVEDGEGKAFVKGGKVYDEDYRPLEKSALTGNASAVGEILLSGVERVYCFGDTDRQTQAFLKKYYQEKAVFC